jgi:hypothetical protein
MHNFARITMSQIMIINYDYMKIKYILYKHNAKIKELPIIFVERILGKSKISSNIIKEGLLMPWILKIQYGKK